LEAEILTIAPKIMLLNLVPPIPGYSEFIGPYLLSGGRSAVIDIGPATAIPSFLSALRKTQMNPEQLSYIIFTHIHIDHAGSAGGAVKVLPKARVIAHPRAHEHLVNPETLWQASLKVLGDYAAKSGPIESVPEDRIVDAVDGMKLGLGDGLDLEIYFTPGHAVHHLCLFYPDAGILFAGEAAGVCIKGAVRLATPPPFKLEVTLSSIDKLIKLKPERLCYSHFGCYGNGVERLELYRKKVVEWYELVNSEARKGSSLEQILEVLREKDKDLDYLDSLGPDIYSRELSLIFNDIRGLAGTNLRDNT